MKIKDRKEFQSKPPTFVLAPTDKVRDAIKEMSLKNLGSVVIVNKDNTIAGIVTERDLMIRVLNDKKDPDKIKLSEIMTTDVRVAKEEDNVIDWLRIMSNERFRHLPVVNDDKHLVTIMSQGDFVSYTWPELLDQVTTKTKDSLGAGYQIALIIGALLIYAVVVSVVQ